jgi:hypothetical protein
MMEEELEEERLVTLSSEEWYTNLILVISELFLQEEEKKRSGPGSRPRIPHVYGVADNIVSHSPQHCRRMTRMTLDELVNLKRYLHPEHASLRYKFPLGVRLIYFLLNLVHSNYYLAQQLHYQWALNSIRMDQQFWVNRIIQVLNAEDSPDAIRGWSSVEYDEFIAAEPNETVPNDIFRNAIGSVDCTNIPIERPFEGESFYYSEKDKGHAMLFLGIIDRYGRIRWIDKGSPAGAASEKQAYERFCMEHRPHLPLDKGIRLLGDGLYNNLQSVLFPYSLRDLGRMRAGPQKNRMKTYNKLLRKYRVQVEWMFGVLKRNWKCLATPWRNDLRLLGTTVLATCLLYNYLRRVRGIDRDALEHLEEDQVDVEFPPRPDEGIMEI